MILNRLTFPASDNQPDIVISLQDDSPFSAEWVSSYFRDAVRTGARFQSGQTVQLGWTTLSIRENAEGSLALWEPDFASMPIVWTQGIDTTLRHLVLQQEVCGELGTPVSFPNLREAGLVSALYDAHHDEFLAMREEPSGSDSGWVFRKRLEVTRDANFRSLYEIAVTNRRVIPFLALPPGAAVSWSKRLIEIEFDGRRISSTTNTFLGRLATSAFS